MARGTATVRRRSSRPKVSRKTSRRTKRVFTNKAVAEAWDVHKTPAQNYAELGLDVNPNSKQQLIATRANAESVTFEDIEEARKIEYSQMLAEKRATSKRYLSADKRAYIQTLYKKYKTDFKAMERDIDLNAKQHSASKLKTMYKHWKEWYEEKGKSEGNSASES